MPDSTMPPPRYSIWQSIAVCLNLATRALEEVRALARDGGKPGPPGLGFDDLTIEFDGERQITLRFARGEQVIERAVRIPAMIYRGVFVDDQDYELGDVVTWGGAMWHCNEATRDRPKTNVTAWTLAVKNGRDGKDGRDGAKGERGPEGKQGQRGDWR